MSRSRALTPPPVSAILTKPEAEQALDTAIALVRRNLPLYTDHCQNHSSVHDIYPQCENNQWTCGFWPGEVWLSYERTGDDPGGQLPLPH